MTGPQSHYAQLHPSMHRPTYRVEYMWLGMLTTEYITGDTDEQASRKADGRADQISTLRGVAVSVFQHTFAQAPVPTHTLPALGERG